MSTKDIVKLTKQLSEEFKRPVYWNEFKTKVESNNDNNLTRFYLDTSFQGNKVERDSHRKSFLPKVNITNYNILIDDRNFYDQPISEQIKKYEELRKMTRR